MALLDRDRNLIVLRIVYDGPPEAGKTTSLRALAGSLGQTLTSPEEQDGRTLYFDWMDYTGGRFEGYQIRCQIVSVPGQAELRLRRHHLLREADVVVYVADSTQQRTQATMRSLVELPQLLPRTDPPIGVVLQANKRDLPDAVPLVELRSALVQLGLGSSVGVVESVAADGTGIRETFVFAVRLALDRVRELLRSQRLEVGRPVIDNAAALFEEMQQATSTLRLATPNEATAVPLVQQVIAENDLSRLLVEFAPWQEAVRSAPSEETAPWPPDPTAPSGAIWPPVEGRLILHEASAMRMTTHRLQNGSWAAGIGNGWRAYSSGDAVFGDLEAGREALIRWARIHVAFARVLSTNRCIVLAATGQGTLRLWQIVRAERSLRDQLEQLDRCATDEAAARIVEVATLLCEMSARLADAQCVVPCTLDTVGTDDRGAVYIGLMPGDRPERESRDTDFGPLGVDLESIFVNALADRRAAVQAALVRAERRTTVSGTGLVERLLHRLAQG